MRRKEKREYKHHHTHQTVASSIYRRSGNFRYKNIFVICANHEKKQHFTTE